MSVGTAGQAADVATDQGTADKLGLPALTAMVVGSMVGAGVFQLPARFATQTGVYGALIAWAIAGTGMLCLAFVFQALAVRKPNLDNGVYVYAVRASASIPAFFRRWVSGPPPVPETPFTGC